MIRMAKHDYQVLILKSQSEDEKEDPYIVALEKQNIPAVLVPVLEFQFINLDRLLDCLNTPERFSGLLFLSSRCVQSVNECFKRGIDAEKKEKWSQLHCFVVGEATARTVSEHLHFPCSGSSSGNFKALLQTIDPSLLDKPLLMPCGTLNKPIPEEKSYSIQKIVVYETRQHSQLKNNLEKLLDDSTDSWLIVFFSPSGVEFALPFIRHITPPRIQFIALGPTTNEAMKEHNIVASAVCQKPNPECLAHEILKITRNEKICQNGKIT